MFFLLCAFLLFLSVFIHLSALHFLFNSCFYAPFFKILFFFKCFVFYPSSIPPCFLLLQTFDKCFLGSSETADVNRVFCGQMGAVYLFAEALSAAQILAIYQLGPGYQVRKRKNVVVTCDIHLTGVLVKLTGCK